MALVQQPAASTGISPLTGREILPDSAESDLLFEQLFEDTGETSATSQAAPETNTIQPNKDEPITDFFKRTGHASLEEFMQDPSNEGKIKKSAKGIPFVLEGVDYQVKSGTPYSAVEFVSTKTGEAEVNKYDEKGALVTGGYPKDDLSGLTVDTTGESLFTPKVDETSSDEGTSTEEGRKGEFDPTEQAVVETPKLTDPPVDIEKEIVSKKVVEDEFDTKSFIDQTNEEIAKLVSQTTITNDTALKIFDDAIGDIKKIKYPTTAETRGFYEDMAKKINADVTAYDKAIDEVAKGEMTPTFEGWNKFLAVLGAAMGAYGAAMTGSPNFALQIMNKAIDADQKNFLATKAMRLKNLNQQRADALQRRATLVQLGINETDRMLQIAQLKIGQQSEISNIEAIKKGLIQQQEKILGDWRLAQTQILATYALKKQAQDLTAGEKSRTRQIKLPGGQVGIFGPTMSDKQVDKALPDIQEYFMGHGKLIGNSGAAQALRDTGASADSIELAEKGYIGMLIELVEKEPIASKIGWTETGKKVRSLHTALKSHYQKAIMKAGANLTGIEVEIVENIVGDPTAGDILFGTYMIGLENLRSQIDNQYAQIIDIQDIHIMNTKDLKKARSTVTGLKKFE
jgi:hypothetical protein